MVDKMDISAFKPFSLAESVQAGQNIRMNQLKLQSAQDQMAKERQIRGLAQMSTSPVYGQAEGPPTPSGATPQIQTGTQYSPQANVQNLQAAGYQDEAAALSDQIAKMDENQRKEAADKTEQIGRLAIWADTPEKWDQAIVEATNNGLVQEGQQVPTFDQRDMIIAQSQKTSDMLTKAKPDNVELTTLQNARAKLMSLPDNKANKQQIEEITKRIEKLTSPTTGQTINVGGGEKAFEKELGKQMGSRFVERRKDAVDAAKSLESANVAIDLLNKGVITGTGANFILGVGKALKQIGLYDGEALSNTEAYYANQAKQVANIIKAFGAGTGLSDADREYAEKAAAGKIVMTEESLRKIIDINARASMKVVNDFNKDAKPIEEKGTIPFKLTIDVPDYTGAEKSANLTDEEYEAKKRALGL